ncbi:MAG TPA: hypothetical protein VNA17_02780, partial [Pyrinomonadaceae bacterium]|nr:hypothetical protein [Pyrinomonadaceae bacterium]
MPHGSMLPGTQVRPVGGGSWRLAVIGGLWEHFPFTILHFQFFCPLSQLSQLSQRFFQKPEIEVGGILGMHFPLPFSISILV